MHLTGTKNSKFRWHYISVWCIIVDLISYSRQCTTKILSNSLSLTSKITNRTIKLMFITSCMYIHKWFLSTRSLSYSCLNNTTLLYSRRIYAVVPVKICVYFLPRMKNVPKPTKMHLNEVGLTETVFCKSHIQLRQPPISWKFCCFLTAFCNTEEMIPVTAILQSC